MLTREQIRAAQDVEPKAVEVEAWGGEVFVREFTLAQRREFGEASTAAEEEGAEDFDTELWLVLHGVCDQAGKLLFDESDREWLQSKSGSVMRDIAQQVLTVNGWDPEAGKEAEGN